MPLSKVRNRERMRQARLHTKKDTEVVQPKPLSTPDNSQDIAYIDADGNLVYDAT